MLCLCKSRAMRGLAARMLVIRVEAPREPQRRSHSSDSASCGCAVDDLSADVSAPESRRGRWLTGLLTADLFEDSEAERVHGARGVREHDHAGVRNGHESGEAAEAAGASVVKQ